MQGKTALGHHARQMPIAERQTEIPTNTKQDDFAFVVSPKKRIGGRDRHRPTLLHVGPAFFATQP